MIVTVDNRVRVPLASLPEAAAAELRKRFTHSNPAFYKRAAMGRYPSRDEPQTIKTWAHEGGCLTVPRGGMSRVREVLRAHSVPWTTEDARTDGELPEPSRKGFPWGGHKLTLWPDQERVVEAVLKRQNCLVRSPTGSGKTSSAIALISRLRLPSLVVVWNSSLFDQWVDRVESELGIDRRWIGKVRGAEKLYSPITVAMQQTVCRITDERFFRHWGIVVADEMDRFAAKTFFPSIDPFPARYRVGVGASEKRKDGKEFLIRDLFGEPAADVSHVDLVEQGRILGVAVDVVRTGFSAPWYSPSEENYSQLLGEMSRDGARNQVALREVERCAREGHQVLVLSQRRDHCARLDQELAARGVRTGLLIGGDDYRDAFLETRDGLRSGALQVGVGTVHAVGRGIDMPAVSRVVVAMPMASNRQNFMQAKGRVCRVADGKKDARMVYLWDEEVFGDRHLRNLIAWGDEVFLDGQPAEVRRASAMKGDAPDAGFFEKLVEVASERA